MQLSVLSYNIHKGFSKSNSRFVLHHIKECINATNADIVLLQEVVGLHEKNAKDISDWPLISQFEFLADKVWPHHAYGKNSIYAEGHHGNAILSKYPITSYENEDISIHRYERRGILHAKIHVPEVDRTVDIACLHLNLLELHRRRQVERIILRLSQHVSKFNPLIVGGDFNDWRGQIGASLHAHLQLREVFSEACGPPARTFPAWWPLFHLDCIYYRGVEVESAEVLREGVWRSLSDHLPVLTTFQLLAKKDEPL